MIDIKIFENKIRKVWDAEREEWFFSIIDIVGILSGSLNPRNYWKVLKHRLVGEGSQVVTDCNQLKLRAKDGKMRETDVADTKVILRIIQSIPSKKAEPFKIWLAKVGSERIDEVADPELSIDRAMKNYLVKGYSEKWINQRLKTIEVRRELTDEWRRSGVEEGQEFAVLTNEITLAWSGKSVKRYKEFKGLKKENLRDNSANSMQNFNTPNERMSPFGGSLKPCFEYSVSEQPMTNLELALNTLAEVTTTEISKKENPEEFSESLDVARRGGGVAGVARRKVEQELGEVAVDKNNVLDEKEMRKKRKKKLKVKIIK